MVTSTTAVDKVAEARANFRGSLEDLITVAEGLSDYCNTVEELVGMAKLALENEAQLSLIINVTTSQKK